MWQSTDIGRTLNQKLAEGQLAGGIAQGIGHVFGELPL